MADDQDLEGLAKSCLDSAGYVCFVAVLTGERDTDGNPVIASHYRRYHFPLEDAKSGVKEFNRQVNEELRQLSDPVGENGV